MAEYDVIFVLPYPFTDHPSFPEGILRRALEADGFSVGVIETPFWQKRESFAVLGEPRLFFAIVSGPVDSVVLNYTSARKRRREDLYQAGGAAFFPGHPPSIRYKIRPDRTVIVFANRLRELFRQVPIVIGGIEASLRRFSHYDFQEEKIRRSILFDSRADILVHGMGEKQIVEIARWLRSGNPVSASSIAGTARVESAAAIPAPAVELPAHEEIVRDRTRLLDAQRLIEKNGTSPGSAPLVQRHENRAVVQFAAERYAASDLERIYGMPYTRSHIPDRVLSPALRMNLFSVTSHRGCGGGCSFCSISMHEGRRVISRSRESIVREIAALTRHPCWKGQVSDIGGPTAEMYGSDCSAVTCARSSCLFPEPCDSPRPGDSFLELLRECRGIRGVEKIFLGSGIRFDLVLKNPELLEEIMLHHAGRFLRIAPEHTEPAVLELMRKPSHDVLREFLRLFRSINRRLKRKIGLAAYIIVGHPGETPADVREMAGKLKEAGLNDLDVQIFTPTPGTLSTAWYWAETADGKNPLAVEKSVRRLQERKGLLPGSGTADR